MLTQVTLRCLVKALVAPRRHTQWYLTLEWWTLAWIFYRVRFNVIYLKVNIGALYMAKRCAIVIVIKLTSTSSQVSWSPESCVLQPWSGCLSSDQMSTQISWRSGICWQTECSTYQRSINYEVGQKVWHLSRSVRKQRSIKRKYAFLVVSWKSWMCASAVEWVLHSDPDRTLAWLVTCQGDHLSVLVCLVGGRTSI